MTMIISFDEICSSSGVPEEPLLLASGPRDLSMVASMTAKLLEATRGVILSNPSHVISLVVQSIDRNHFSFPNSMGRFMPTLLADNRTRSSSSIPMPGLYLSSSVIYVLCARTYARYCSACATACSGVVSGRKCSRRRWWIGDGVLERMGRGGSSRRNER